MPTVAQVAMLLAFSAFALLFSVVVYWLAIKTALKANLGMAALVVACVLLCIAAWPLMTQRRLNGFEVLLDADSATIASGLWVNRAANALLLFSLLTGILHKIIARKEANQAIDWPLMLSFLGYFLSNYIINGLYGSTPGFLPQAPYTAAFVIAIILVGDSQSKSHILVLRNGIFILSLAGLLMIPVSPWTVIQNNYTEGFSTYRFWGLASHANTMGPLLVAGQCLTYCHPFVKPYVNKGAHLLLMVALLATQSKTAIICSVVCLSYLVLRDTRKSWFSALRIESRVAASTFALAIVGGLLLMVAGNESMHSSFSGSQSLSLGPTSSILTLTNRDIIWAAALKEFQRNIIFGYGPTIFSEDFRVAIGIRSAIHGHNQLIHSISSAGILGLACLLLYLLVLAKRVLNASSATTGLSVSLFALLLIRSVTETPLTLHAPVSSEYLMHAALLIIISNRDLNKLDSRSLAGPQSEA